MLAEKGEHQLLIQEYLRHGRVGPPFPLEV
jgi:hypothetical protein